MKYSGLLLTLLLLLNFSSYGQEDEFYHELYDSMHDSPMQQKFRKLVLHILSKSKSSLTIFCLAAISNNRTSESIKFCSLFTFKSNLLSRWLLRYRQFHVWNWFVQSIRNRLNFVWMLFLHECCASKERRSPAYIIVLVHMNWKLSFLAYHYGNPFECVCLRMIHKKTVKFFKIIDIFSVAWYTFHYTKM